jgi:hypothetical protein
MVQYFQSLYIRRREDVMLRFVRKILEVRGLFFSPSQEDTVIVIEQPLECLHLWCIVSNDGESLPVVIIQEIAWSYHELLNSQRKEGGSRTELSIFIKIPLIEMEVEKLQPMKVRGMADKPRNAVRCGEDTFTSLKVFEAKTVEVQWMESELAGVVVSVPVEGINSQTKPEALGIRTQGA